jgi:hypothetical protein
MNDRDVYCIHHANVGASSSVSDADRYVIIGKVTRFYFQHISAVHKPAGNSHTPTQNFSSVRLATQGMTWHGSKSGWTLLSFKSVYFHETNIP